MSSKKPEVKRSDPLNEPPTSSLYDIVLPAPPLPTLPRRQPEMPPVEIQPEEATVSSTPVPVQPVQSTQPAPAQEKDLPLLYKSEHSADWLTRSYIDQYDKQALSADPYYIGAVEAGCVLLRMSKTEAFNEMMVDWLSKHADVLEARPDVVRLKEEKYRKKHRI